MSNPKQKFLFSFCTKWKSRIFYCIYWSIENKTLELSKKNYFLVVAKKVISLFSLFPLCNRSELVENLCDNLNILIKFLKRKMTMRKRTEKRYSSLRYWKVWRKVGTLRNCDSHLYSKFLCRCVERF